ncbi:MAG: hypothetical protein ABH872_06600 [Candidatus Omnitrophota bacterium]
MTGGKKFSDTLKQMRINLSSCKAVNYAFLFGSSLNNFPYSRDIDILIGGVLPFIDRVNLASDLEVICKKNVDLVLADEAPVELVMKAFSSGYPILIRDKEKLKEDYFRYFYAYDDKIDLKQIEIARLKRRYNSG